MDRAYDLEEYGLTWDRTDAAKYYLSMTGGGSFARTMGSVDEGIGITEVMLHQLYARGVRICDFHMLADVVQDDDGRAAGALVLDLSRGAWRYFPCSAVVIATGGTSQLYETSSGPVINTGDGIAIALRAGAELVDIEFMQFIPISFVYPPSARGYTLTEPAHYGMRHFDPKAEAAHLLNSRGERFVLKHDPARKEGSTRDILARAIMLEILEGRGTPEGGVLMMPDPKVFDSFYAREACLGRPGGVRPPEIKARLQKLMWDHVGLVRSGSRLEQTLRALRELRDHVWPSIQVTNQTRILNREWMEALELENMIDIAEAMALASLMRKETRGAHYRTDFPGTDPGWTANIWVKREGRELKIEKKPVVALGAERADRARPLRATVR